MRRFLPSLITIVIIVIFSVLQRELLSDIFSRLGQVEPFGIIPLLGAGSTVIVARGLFLQACSPGISLSQAVTADQSALAAGYGIAIGGGAVGTAMRIHMFSRWALSPSAIASSIVATAVWPSFTTWGLPVVVLLLPILQGDATTVHVVAWSAGLFLVITSGVFWWVALRWRFVFSYVGRFGQYIREKLLRRLPTRMWRTRKLLERTRPDTFTDELRISLGHLVRQRGVKIFLSSCVTLAASFLCLWTSAELFGARGLTLGEALIAFSLIRVLIALSPIPGAVGIAELGLVALLEQEGLSTLDATGTTLLYRFLTWFLPMVVGTVLWWRYSHKRQGKTHGSIRDDNSFNEDPRRGLHIHGESV
ncbi:MAG: hypothetical protein RIR69_922 [Actinomycetota bacterium]